jgi:hypothetical protein
VPDPGQGGHVCGDVNESRTVPYCIDLTKPSIENTRTKFFLIDRDHGRNKEARAVSGLLMRIVGYCDENGQSFPRTRAEHRT